MNSKLHLLFSFLLASGALAFGVFAAAPATSLAGTAAGVAMPGSGALDLGGDPAARPSYDRAIAAHVEAVAQQINPRASVAAVEKSRYASGKTRRIRQSMAMPFFSFAPRG